MPDCFDDYVHICKGTTLLQRQHSVGIVLVMTCSCLVWLPEGEKTYQLTQMEVVIVSIAKANKKHNCVDDC